MSKKIFSRLIAAVTALAMILSVSGIGETKLTAHAMDTFYSSETVPENESRDYDSLYIWGYYGHIDFVNNGTANDVNGLTLDNASLINNGNFSFSGADKQFPVFRLGNASSFINKGTAVISKAALLDIEAGNSFINEGTLHMENIESWNSVNGTYKNSGLLYLSNIIGYDITKPFTDFTNTGYIIYDDTVNINLVAHFKDLFGADKVVTQDEYGNLISHYDIAYDLGKEYYQVENDNISSYAYTPLAPETITLNDPVWTGYTFLGWTGSNGDQPEKNLSFSTGLQQNLSFKANWAPNTYQITYDMDGGCFMAQDQGKVKYSYTYADNTYVLPAAYKDGYTFTGWTGSNGDIPQTWVYIAPHSMGDKNFTANFVDNSSVIYTVVRHYQKIDGSAYQTESTKIQGTLFGTAEADPDDYAREGFTFHPEKSTVSAPINDASSTVLDLYYDRNKYTAVFKSWDGSEIIASREFYYQQQITYDMDDPETASDEDYDYAFAGWSDKADSDRGVSKEKLAYIKEDTTYYAAFTKTAKFVLITWKDFTGFAPPPNTVTRLNIGEDYTVELALENEHYYVGTPEWSDSLHLDSVHIYWQNAAEGIHGLLWDEDFFLSHGEYGSPVVLTIPNVEHDLYISMRPGYHAEHDYSDAFDTVLKPGGCTEDSVIRHLCYKCGKTETETVPAKGHTPSDHWSTDETNHWKLCSKCQTVLAPTAHTFVWITDKEPTSADMGYRHEECSVCGYRKEAAAIPPTDVEEPDAKLDIDIAEGIHRIPDTLSAAGYDTAEKITEALIQSTIANTGFVSQNIIVYDISLKISFDGGATWEEADMDNFPAEGLAILLPYPTGTNKTDYDFMVTHMFTHDMNGHKAGEIETPAVTETDEGILFTVEGLSPISMAWKTTAPSHIHNYDSKWHFDADSHWLECPCGDRTQLQTHNLVWTAVKEAEEGVSGVRRGLCGVCGYERTEEIPPLGHTHSYGSDWHFDAHSHWLECSCGDSAQTQAHSLVWTAVKEAEEGVSGVRRGLCGVCGYERTEEIPPLGHTHSYGSNWHFDAHSHWLECSCGDSAQTQTHSFVWTAVKEAEEGVSGVRRGLCGVCGYERTEEIPPLGHEHSYSACWSSDEDRHWRECSCGDDVETDVHHFNWTTIKEASSAQPGTRRGVCAMCGYEKTAEIPPSGHTHSYGSKWIFNGENHWHGCSCGEISGFAAHTFRQITNTESASGAKHEVCTICGYERESVPAPGTTSAPAAGTPAPGTETPAPDTGTPAPDTETPAPGMGTPAPDTETPAPGTETPAPDTETPAPDTETPAPEGGTPAPDNDNDAPSLPAADITSPATDGGAGFLPWLLLILPAGAGLFLLILILRRKKDDEE